MISGSIGALMMTFQDWDIALSGTQSLQTAPTFFTLTFATQRHSSQREEGQLKTFYHTCRWGMNMEFIYCSCSIL